MRQTALSFGFTIAMSLGLSLSLGSGVPTAAAEPEPPVERTVTTSDGAMYRGEVLEYVSGDHITLKLDTGEQRRILWNDATQISPPRPKGSKAPPPEPAKPAPPPPPPPVLKTEVVPTVVPPGTERTITNQDGLTVHGEVLEYEVGSHILLKPAVGERRRIPWAEAKRISPPRSSEPGGYSPERTIILRDGTTLRGDLVESMVGDYTTLKLAGGAIRRVAWTDAKRILLPRPEGAPSPIPMTGELLITLDNGSRIQGTYFEFVPDDHLVLRHASGRFRIIPVRSIKQILQLGDASANP